ncbi:unnamed protein product [Schistosoma mattheei]|uniref:Uncharacterized protein n=1 Tax=Schistosoma mattheei TaxID=31246 RepID=A0A183PZJ1_9TREM|nr:unnamed protein product [Schistosoma mattheei]
MGHIPTVEEHMELKTTVCKPTSKSESPIRTSRQFYYRKLKRRELLQPSSKNASIYKQLSKQEAQCPSTGYHQQQLSVEEYKPASK